MRSKERVGSRGGIYNATLGQSLKNVLKSIIDAVRKQRKWNHIKHPIKIKRQKNRGRRKQGTKNKDKKSKKTLLNIIDINPNITIITLRVNGQIHQLKHRHGHSESKNKPQLHVFYQNQLEMERHIFI